MRKIRQGHRLARDSLTQGLALACLLLMGGFALAGPSGMIAWGEQQRLLEQHRAEVAALSSERDQMRNRVELLDPEGTDADLAGELVRSRLNVAHPDEMVMLLD